MKISIVRYLIYVCNLLALLSLSIKLNAQTGFLPSDISGLSLWITGDSAQITTPPFIDKCYDLSGNSNHAIQASSSSKPSRVTSILNGHKIIRFDGITNFLALPSLDFKTVFLVAKTNEAPVSNYKGFIGGPISSTGIGGYLINTIAGTHDLALGTTTTDFLLMEKNGLSVLPGGSFFPIDQFWIGTFIFSINRLQTADIGRMDDGNFPLRYLNGDIAEIIVYNQALMPNQLDSVELYLRKKYAPPVNLGADINISNSFCDTTLNAGIGYNSYLWSTGETTPIISVNDSGKYWVQTIDIFGITTSDTLHIAFPAINYPTGSNVICIGETKVWNTNLPKSKFTFQWQDNSTDSLLIITQAGSYHVKITDSAGCFVRSDTINISVDNFNSIASLGPDTSFCSGNTIYLKNGYSQATGYLWSSGSTNDSIAISTSGQYWVSVTNINGCIKKDTINVTVSGTAPTSNFSYNTTCLGANTQFNDLSVPPSGNYILTWYWDFGDATTSNIQNPIHLYTDTGTYFVQLKVTTEVGCEASLNKTIKVFPNPIANFNSANLCENANVQFSGNAITFGYPINQWSWDFADMASGSNNFSTLQNPIHLFGDTLTHSVSLIVQNIHGCNDTVVVNQKIKPSPISDFTFSLACQKDSILFSDNSEMPLSTNIQSSFWDFGDATSSILLNTNHLFNSAAPFNVTHLVVATNNCRDSIVKQVLVYPSPITAFSNGSACVNLPTDFTDLSSISSGTITQWKWNFNNAITSFIQNPQFTSSNSGNFSVHLEITSDLGCKDSLLQIITINELPVADFTYNIAYGNPPVAVNFTNSSTNASSYLWNFGDGNQSSETNPTHIYLSAGNYEVSLTAENIGNCINSFITSFTLQNNPQYNFLPSQIPDLQLWFIGDSLHLSLSSTDTIYDLSINHNNATQTNPNFRPQTEILPLLNGHKTLKFDGDDDYLKFNEITDIRTVIWIIKEDSLASSKYRPLLGDSLLLDFARGDNKEIWSSINTSANILAGKTKLNSNIINGESTILEPRWSFISNVTTGNVTADNFSFDRYVIERVWKGNLAELIIYNRALTNSQIDSLENYIRSKYTPPVNLGPDIHTTHLCPIKIKTQNRFVKYLWNTTIFNPEDTLSDISVSNSGIYSVTTTDVFGFTSIDSINVFFPNLSMPDSTICFGDTINYIINNSSINLFSWSNGSLNNTFETSTGGEFSVQMTDNLGCNFKDTFNVYIDSLSLQLHLGNDTTLCSGNSISPSGGNNITNYLWIDSSTNQNLVINSTGDYWVSVTNINGCVAKDTIHINIHGIAPVAGFSNSAQCVNNQIVFSDTSQTLDGSHIIDWQWIIYNDTTTNPTASTVFNTIGTYQVTLTITTDSNCANTISKNITINPNPIASYKINGTCKGGASYFTNQSYVSQGFLSNMNWNFGNLDSSILLNPEYTFPDVGFYDVQLITTSNNGCKDTITKTIEIKHAPLANFDFSPACTGSATWFFDLTQTLPIFPITIWNWQFGDGDSSLQQNPQHIYNSVGQYPVKLIINSLNGCADTLVSLVSVSAPPVAGFIGDSTCLGLPINFLDTSFATNGNIYKWHWNFGNGTSSSIYNPSVDYANTGNYAVNLKVTSSVDCIDEITKIIKVFPLPVPNFSCLPNLGAPPLSVNFENSTSNELSFWNFGDGEFSILTSPIHVFNNIGDYTIWLKSENSHGCIDSIFRTVKVVPNIHNLAILSIDYSINSNYLTASTVIANMGTMPIIRPLLTLSTDKSTPVMEVYSDTIFSSETINYTFAAQLPFSENNQPSYICVKGILPPGISDNDYSNNEACKTNNTNSLILNIYPNPTNSEINLDLNVIIPGISTLDIFDKEGRFVYSNQIVLEVGFNRIKIDVKSFSKGKYTIRLISQESENSAEFIKY